MLEREGDLCQAFDSRKDEEDLYLEGVRVTVVGLELFMAPFDATRFLVEDNWFWETFRELRDSEDFKREGTETAFSAA